MNNNSSNSQSSSQQQHPVFNGQYEILKSLGEGNTSKVYLGRSLANPASTAAIKILKEEFLRRDEGSIVSVQNEITILRNLEHGGIIRMLDYGDAGRVVKPSGRVISNLVFIVMECVEGGLLFDMCQLMGGMGEDAGRFFATQLLDSLEYMHGQRVVHRDLKLENILVDERLNLKIADFGFACYKNVDSLKSYRGTMTYMAPEIKEGKQYRGSQVDLFSMGVILFIIVQGIFPFKEARREEYFYNLIVSGQTDYYQKKVNGDHLSAEFMDLILALFSYDPDRRPTIEQLRAHPWLAAPAFDFEATRETLLAQVAQKAAAQQSTQPPLDDMPMTKPVKHRRNTVHH